MKGALVLVPATLTASIGGASADGGVPGGHGDYLGEAVMTQTDSQYPELTARLILDLLDPP